MIYVWRESPAHKNISVQQILIQEADVEQRYIKNTLIGDVFFFLP